MSKFSNTKCRNLALKKIENLLDELNDGIPAPHNKLRGFGYSGSFKTRVSIYYVVPLEKSKFLDIKYRSMALKKIEGVLADLNDYMPSSDCGFGYHGSFDKNYHIEIVYEPVSEKK